MFDEITKQNLKYYVYFLIDTGTKKPFYIGKGKDNRVFNHINQKIKEIKEETENLKYQEILRIGAKNVEHIIVRHGLSESAAFDVEASLIDTFDYIKTGITNIARGQKSIEKGLMTSDEIKSLYNAEILDTVDCCCIIININRTYKRGAGVNAIYNATKETWKMAYWRPKKYKYVLSEYNGLIVEVFKVKNWYKKERPDKYGKLYNGYGFNGSVAGIKVRNSYVDKSIKEVKPRGYGWPVVYPEKFREWVKVYKNKLLRKTTSP